MCLRACTNDIHDSTWCTKPAHTARSLQNTARIEAKMTSVVLGFLVLLLCVCANRGLRPTRGYINRRLAAESTTTAAETDETGDPNLLLPLEPEASGSGVQPATCTNLDVGLQTFFDTVQRNYACIGEMLNFKDCCELNFLRAKSGVYRVQRRLAWCDMETDYGGWTVLVRRKDGRRDFRKSWSHYRQGFGFLNRDFWFGLEAIHEMTTNTEMEMRVDLEYDNGTKLFAHYHHFSVSSARDNFRLSVSGYDERSTAPDAMLYHDQIQFSTRDRDNDIFRHHCARLNAGGWWFRSCFRSHLNVYYYFPRTPVKKPGAIWTIGYTPDRFAFAEMKIRPSNKWYCGTAETPPNQLESYFLRNIK